MSDDGLPLRVVVFLEHDVDNEKHWLRNSLTRKQYGLKTIVLTEH